MYYCTIGILLIIDEIWCELVFVSIHEKIKKLKKIKKSEIFKAAGNEKTGVVNSLVLLGSIASFFAVVEHEVNAIDCKCDSETGEIEDTGLDAVLKESNNWRNHCWSWGWGWCWGWVHTAGR